MNNKQLNASIPAQRAMIWLSIILLILFAISLVALLRFFPPPPAYLSAEEVAALYRAHSVRMKIGAMLGMTSGGCLIPLSLVISIQMARLEKGIPIWALLQGLTGVVGSAFFWLPMLIFATAAFTPERSPQLTLILHEFGWLAFITPLALFPLQLIGVIVVSFTKDEEDQHSAFPRWIGYLSAWNFVQAFGGPIAVLFKKGIFAWHGLLPFYLPFAVFSLWIPAMSYTVLRALRQQERAEAGRTANDR